jgi:hypothetical protein
VESAGVDGLLARPLLVVTVTIVGGGGGMTGVVAASFFASGSSIPFDGTTSFLPPLTVRTVCCCCGPDASVSVFAAAPSSWGVAVPSFCALASVVVGGLEPLFGVGASATAPPNELTTPFGLLEAVEDARGRPFSRLE